MRGVRSIAYGAGNVIDIVYLFLALPKVPCQPLLLPPCRPQQRQKDASCRTRGAQATRDQATALFRTPLLPSMFDGTSLEQFLELPQVEAPTPPTLTAAST